MHYFILRPVLYLDSTISLNLKYIRFKNSFIANKIISRAKYILTFWEQSGWLLSLRTGSCSVNCQPKSVGS